MQDDQSTQKKSTKPIFITIAGLAIAIVLVIVGILLHFNYSPTDESGKTISELKSELSSLNAEIEELSKTKSQAFHENGFTESYREVANEVGQKNKEKINLEDKIYALEGANSKKSIVSTGALWFFIAGFIVIVITIIFSILSRSARARSL